MSKKQIFFEILNPKKGFLKAVKIEINSTREFKFPDNKKYIVLV